MIKKGDIILIQEFFGSLGNRGGRISNALLCDLTENDFRIVDYYDCNDYAKYIIEFFTTPLTIKGRTLKDGEPMSPKEEQAFLEYFKEECPWVFKQRELLEHRLLFLKHINEYN